VAFTAFFFIAGCNGHSNPVVGDDPEGVFRMAQAFGDIENPGTGRALDSATTMWTYPWPYGEYAGDIADQDIILGNVRYPLVTAFVWRDEPVEAEIHLLLKDSSWDTVWTDTFSYDTGMEDEQCRHPAVEVTYSRPFGLNVGTVRVHVVWSQLTDDDPEDWDVYYRCITYSVGPFSGPDWDSPTTDETVVLPECSPSYNEIHPDICILPSIDSLFAICVVNDPDDPDVQLVMAAQHLHDDMGDPDSWEPAFLVAPDDSDPKASPSIDAGLFTPTLSPVRNVLGIVAAVWTEMATDQDLNRLQVYYNEWDSLDEADPYCAVKLTDGGDDGKMHNGLARIDVPSFSGGVYCEAVITWVSVTQTTTVPPEFLNYSVGITATPDLDEPFTNLQDSRFNRCPDVACYQMYVPQDGDQFVGISYYHQDGPGDPWEVSARSYSFQIDNGEAAFAIENTYRIPDTDGWWGLESENRNTGSTLCLRNPYIPGDWYNQEFAIGWIDTSECNVMLAQGSIYD
jgi:hypothetical protein